MALWNFTIKRTFCWCRLQWPEVNCLCIEQSGWDEQSLGHGCRWSRHNLNQIWSVSKVHDKMHRNTSASAKYQTLPYGISRKFRYDNSAASESREPMVMKPQTPVIVESTVRSLEASPKSVENPQNAFSYVETKIYSWWHQLSESGTRPITVVTSMILRRSKRCLSLPNSSTLGWNWILTR